MSNDNPRILEVYLQEYEKLKDCYRKGRKASKVLLPFLSSDDLTQSSF